MSERSVFTMRAHRRTLRALQEEARRYGLPPRTLAERMIEEGVKMRRHPGIVFIERGSGTRDAVLAGRPRLSVWQIVGALRVSKTRAAVARSLSLDAGSIDRAMAYAKEYPDEIEAAIEANEAAHERVERLYPSSAELISGRRRAPRSR